MPTAIEVAAREAGLPVLTQQQRIWNWLNDHPKQTANAVIAAKCCEAKNVSTLLSQMMARKMLKVDFEFSRTAGREVSHYSVATKEYIILPAPKKDKKSKAAPDEGKTLVQGPNTKLAIVEIPKGPAPVVPVAAAPPAEFNAKDFVDKMFKGDKLSLRDARAVYKELKEIFE